MTMIVSKSGIKQRVSKALIKAEFSNLSYIDETNKTVTLLMNKQSIINLRSAYEDAIKNGLLKFPLRR